MKKTKYKCIKCKKIISFTEYDAHGGMCKECRKIIHKAIKRKSKGRGEINELT